MEALCALLKPGLKFHMGVLGHLLYYFDFSNGKKIAVEIVKLFYCRISNCVKPYRTAAKSLLVDIAAN